MPIKDLIWACPHCHTIESLDREGRCGTCHVWLRRGRGAQIVLSAGGGTGEERSPADWLARLPWPDLDGEGKALPAGLVPPFEAEVQLRAEQRQAALRRGDYLGRIEVFGPPLRGRLRVDARRFVFEPVAGEAWSSTTLDLLSIQPASSAIQLRARGKPVISLAFAAGSVRLWEQRLKFCVRQAWSAAGRGEITEFQPQIRGK